jgi:hypothetical protein
LSPERIGERVAFLRATVLFYITKWKGILRKDSISRASVDEKYEVKYQLYF